MDKDTYSKEAQQALHIAGRHAKQTQQEKIMPAHLLKAVLHKDVGLVDVINAMGKDYYYILDWAEARIQRYPRASRFDEDPDPDSACLAVLEEAHHYSIKLSLNQIDPICILAALCTPGVGFTFEQLKTMVLTHDELIEQAAAKKGQPAQISVAKAGSSGKVKDDYIRKYCHDKISQCLNEGLEPVFGMDKEIRSIMETLGRKYKSNVLVTGESGVGKSTLINGLTIRLSQDNIPDILEQIRLYELDLGALTAGASYQGEIEDRLKKTLDEVKQQGNSILIIESIDRLFDKHNSLYVLSGFIRHELNRGEHVFLGTSSVEGYTKHLETDAEINGKFEQIKLEEPDEENALRIVRGVIPSYEAHHGIAISKDLLILAVQLSKRYLSERRLPESAIDLVDRTFSLLNTMNATSLNDIKQLKDAFTAIRDDQDADPETKREQMKWFLRDLQDRISASLLIQIEDIEQLSNPANLEDLFAHTNNLLSRLEKLSANKKTVAESQDLMTVVAERTGIPVGKIQTRERERLLSAEDILKERIVGQDHAIQSIIGAIYESRSGLNKKGQPMGSFFFLGPTGTGKTELAKAMAEFLFQDESSIIRFDMSEFKEEHSAALLYGAPPGYVGYEEGGALVNKIRQKPYSVVLFDEIEKAHPSVFDIFLQILDEGKLHDRLGRTGDFANALIIFTSNIGSAHISEAFAKGTIPTSNELLEVMTAYFRPEFLGRLTEIVPFSPISEEVVQLIFDIHMKTLFSSLKDIEVSLTIDDQARKSLAMSGYSKNYGARPILGIIRNQIRRPLSKMVIAGEINKGDHVFLSKENGNIKWNTKKIPQNGV